MEGSTEATGLAATGALAARALERPGAGAHGATASAGTTSCLNCGTALVGPFCHACGQKAHLHRSIGHIFEELVHGVLHWDSKGWRTLPLLVAQPGRLTRDYVEGKRARYIAPLSLFLALFLLMFLSFSFLGPAIGGDVVEVDEPDRTVAEIERELARVRADPDAPPGLAAALEAGLAAARRAQARERATSAGAAAGKGQPGTGAGATPGAASADQSEPTLHTVMREASQQNKIDLEINGRPLTETTERLRKALANPELTLYKIQQKAYKLAFLLVPMSVPILWLLFIGRRGVRLYDHTVFVLYSLSFMSLLAIIVVLAQRIGEPLAGLAALAAILAPPVHMFAQLRGAYGLGWRGALWRALLLAVGAAAVATLYLSIMLLLGLLD
jgi:hypothetical protein